MEDLTGMQLGPYRIVAPLGEGGMATVYKAYQPGMDRYVAVKILPRQLAQDPQFVGRFKQEARLIAKLVHPHILPIHDFGEAEGYTYLVMPYIEGGTLKQLLTGRPLPLAQTLNLVTQLADALDYAHSLGIVHRDIKPSNVLIDQRGHCLLTDFGIARMVEGTTQFTQTGSTVGTPAYMSPEQGRGDKVSQRSDIYSLGVMLYELATGRVPFDAETPVAVIFKHIQDPLPPPRTINPVLPEGVERVIFKAMAKHPADRYATAAEMAQALKAAIDATLPGARDVTTVSGAFPAAPLPSGVTTRLAADIPLQPAARGDLGRVLPWLPSAGAPRTILLIGGVVLLVLMMSGTGTLAYLAWSIAVPRAITETIATGGLVTTETPRSSTQPLTQTQVPQVSPTPAVPTAIDTRVASATRRLPPPSFTARPAPTDTPPPPTRQPTAVTPAFTEASNWRIDFNRRFPTGFWTPGSHAYTIAMTCPNSPPDWGGTWTHTFEVADTAPVLPADVYLRIGGLRYTAGGSSPTVIHPTQPTIAEVSEAEITYPQAELAATDCTATVSWDGGPPQALAAQTPYQP